jgi:hypothetical protein
MTSEKKKAYLLAPVSDLGDVPAQQVISTLLKSGWYVLSERGSARLGPGDEICVYQKGVGIVSRAVLASERQTNRLSYPFEQFPWAYRIRDYEIFIDKPIVISLHLRTTLDAFYGKNPSRWAWFVQSAHSVSEHDFKLLTNSR